MGRGRDVQREGDKDRDKRQNHISRDKKDNKKLGRAGTREKKQIKKEMKKQNQISR